MPRGDNPNSRANLITFNERSEKEVREMNSRGGKKSGEVRRAQASLTASLKQQCTPEVLEELTATVIEQARNGNLKAFELIRDQLGEKPTEKIAIQQVDTEKVDEIEDLINGIDTGTGKDD